MAQNLKTYEEIIQEAQDSWSKNSDGTLSSTQIERMDSVKKVLDGIIEDYTKLFGLSKEEIIIALEKERNCNCINWYQPHSFPRLDTNIVQVFDTLADFRKKYPSGVSICAGCGKESTDYHECTQQDCDWKAYGLFRTAGKGIKVLIKEKILQWFARPVEIFLPIELSDKKLETKLPTRSPEGKFLVRMLESYKGLKKREEITCFAETDDSYCFDYAGEFDESVGYIPKSKAVRFVKAPHHDLNISSEFFDAVESGVKTSEIRKNDRNYAVGDTFTLNEVSADDTRTGRTIGKFRITHICNYEQKDDMAVFSFVKDDKKTIELGEELYDDILSLSKRMNEQNHLGTRMPYLWFLYDEKDRVATEYDDSSDKFLIAVYSDEGGTAFSTKEDDDEEFMEEFLKYAKDQYEEESEELEKVQKAYDSVKENPNSWENDSLIEEAMRDCNLDKHEMIREIECINNPFFTEESALAYFESNKHNLRTTKAIVRQEYAGRNSDLYAVFQLLCSVSGGKMHQ